MRKIYPYLKDSSFLKKFDAIRDKEQYVKITVLDFLEKPLQDIQGQVTGGTLNVDGNSTIRRTCNIQLIAIEAENDLTNVNSILSINKKVDVEIGFLNNTGEYPDYPMLWFPIGIYVITNPTISNTVNGVSISLQLKDKMCLLNGECGGTLPASVDFHEYETLDENGQYVIIKPTIYQIIQEAVNHFGGEQLTKIIISDVDTRIKQVMRWIGGTPLYLIENAGDSTIQYLFTTDRDEANQFGNYKTYEYGTDVGYIYTDFTYPGELIGNAGDSVCTILDKIKSTLGNYEYFYDIEGNFIFREIKNYLNTTQAKVELNSMNQSDYLIDINRDKAVYAFDDSTLITAYNNTPQYNMIKNDFVVWGIRETADGSTYPIRYHLAIDEKPQIGNTYEVFFIEDELDGNIKAKCPLLFNNRNDLPPIGQQEVFYKTTNDNKIYKWDPEEKEYQELEGVTTESITTKDWRTELYLSGTMMEPMGVDSNFYYTELKDEWPKLYDVKEGKFFDEVLKHQSDIDFYLDFIDSSAAISELSISNIGRRAKVVNDDSVNCVFEPEIPNLVIVNTGDKNFAELRDECIAQGQDYVQVDSNIFSMTTMGGGFNSAYNMVRELLYQYTSYNESISITAIPIFYLEANSRITVRDVRSGIYGDYMINSYSIPFDVNGTMTISCTRALERI